MGKRRRRVSRNMHKGPMDKDNRKEARTECGRWGWVGWERIMGEKMGTTVIEKQ